MGVSHRRQLLAATLATSAALVLAGCGSVNNTATPSKTASTAAAKDCGTWGMAMHAWNGYTASASVVTEVAKAQGCTINQTTLEEANVTYDAMEAGSTDVIIEDWGGGRWKPWVDRGSKIGRAHV